MRCMERHRLVEQHHRDLVLQADIGDVAIVHHGRDRRREPHRDSLDLAGLERLLGAERLDPVERALNGRADRPLLDIGLGDLVTLAELFNQSIGLRLRRVGLEEIVGAGEDIVDAVPARFDQQRRGDPVARRHAGEHKGLLDVIGVAPPGDDP